PKPESEMPGYVEGFVTLPIKRPEMLQGLDPSPERQAHRDAGVLFPGNSHTGGFPNVLGWFRGYMETDPQGKKTFHIIEVQSDWAAKAREIKERIDSGTRFERQRQEELGKIQHPLLPSWERLTLKAAIDHAIKNGADKIAVSDAETAMMTEGHDALGPTVRAIGGE